ncbi:MAG: VRR-NUC domain-containing protein [Acidobacteriota bacterium]
MPEILEGVGSLRYPRPMPPLAEGYYADNFQSVIDTAYGRYHDLLTEEEVAYHRAFSDLDPAPRRLYVRLVSRRGPLVRLDRLDYPEIGDLGAAVDALVSAGLLDFGADAPAGEWVDLLLRAELVALALDELPGAGGWAPSARRGDLLLALIEGLEPEALASAVQARVRALRPLGQEYLLVYRLLFFGNLGQDWTELLLRDLGVLRFEPYELRRELRLFDCREAIDHGLGLRLLRDQATDLLAAGELGAAGDLARGVAQSADRWHTSARRYVDRILVAVARDLERAGRLEAALELYSPAHRPPARERRCRVLLRLDRDEEALALAREIEASPRDETEAVFAPAFAHRVARRLGQVDTPWRRPKRPTVDLEMPVRYDDVSVEWQVLAALEGDGRCAVYTENWLWRSLFGLAFWDIIFSPVSGAFEHPFQAGPLDLHGPEFRASREAAVAERLRGLAEEGDLESRILSVYRAKRGTVSTLVAWQAVLEPPLRAVLRHLRGPELAVVCERLSRDPGRYGRGFPDLFVVAPDAPGGFELWEVKAPGDQIRPEQGAWIDHLNDRGVVAKVLRVRWADRGSDP